MLATRAGPSGAAAYRRIAADIAAGIRGGTPPPGAHLASEAELAARHGVARGTIRQTLALLQAEGLISSRQGARHTVLPAPRLQSFSELMSFSMWARARGERPEGRVIELVRRHADPEESQRLDAEPGAIVYVMTRLRILSGTPVMIERTTYPEWLGRLVATIDGETDSITERLQESGIIFALAEHTIDAVACGAGDARLLGVRPGAPLLRERRRTTSPSGRPLEYSDDRYRADAVAFTVRNSAASNNLTLLPAPSPERESQRYAGRRPVGRRDGAGHTSSRSPR